MTSNVITTITQLASMGSHYSAVKLFNQHY